MGILCLVQVDIKRILFIRSSYNLMLCRLIIFYKVGMLERFNDNFSWTVFFRDILYSKFRLRRCGCYF